MDEKYLVSLNATVKETIETMTKRNIKAVVIVDKEKKVCGVFSNGDMRSYFLKGGDLTQNIRIAMNAHPFLYKNQSEVEEERRKFERVIYPIVDDEGVLLEVLDYGRSAENEIVSDELENVPLVIMAGGKGTRLYPFTQILPKPLIPIGDLTITERIINSFTRYGCNRVIMVLNYKASMIRAYMTELDKTYDVEYVEEKDFLGTAGGLRLIRDKVDSTFFVSNCDTLIHADLECVYRTHKKNGNKITFVCSMKDMVIPYGVIKTTENGQVSELQEKPEFSFLVNTGLYMLEPEVLDEIEEGEFIHLPELAERYMNKGEKVGVFPIPGKAWLDMGQLEELENMKKELGI